MIRAGALRHLLAIEKPEHSVAATGGAEQSWAHVADVWCSVEGLAGSEFVIGDQVVPATTHKVTMRHRDDVTAAMRLNGGGWTYHVVAAFDPTGLREELICGCTEMERNT